MVLIPTGPDGRVHYKAYLTSVVCVVVTIMSVLGFRSRLFLDEVSMELTRIRILNWFTAPLAHEFVSHFLLNIAFFWIIGQVLEGRFGFWKYLGAILVIAWTHTMSSQLFFFWIDRKSVV